MFLSKRPLPPTLDGDNQSVAHKDAFNRIVGWIYPSQSGLVFIILSRLPMS
jgi:hypothetical protein